MSNTQRIMMLVLNLDIGGQEQMIMELCNELRRQGVETLVCCLDQAGALAKEAESEGIQVLALKKGPGFKIGTVLKLRRLIKAQGVTTLHSHNNAGLVYGALGTVGSNVPHVHTRHGVGEVGRWAQWRNRLCGYAVDHLVAVSDSLKQTSIHQDRMPRDKISVIANGVNVGRFLSLELPATSSDAPVIGHIARLSDVKNQALLLRLFAQFLERKPSARLVIVGDGPNAPQLRQQAAKLGITECVTFTGARRDIPALLSGFHWFALTSISEGTPISVIEAMAAGRPVVSTDVGGMKEIVQHGQTGYLVNPDQPEAMLKHWLRLADEPGLTQRLGAAARASVKAAYSAEAMASAYRGVYLRE